MMIKYSLLLVLLIGIQCIFSSPYNCCVPKVWSGSSVTTGPDGSQVAAHNYYYDSTNLRVRIDTFTQYLNQTTYSTYKDLKTTGTEWVLDNLNETCSQTGPDFWNYQCFGVNYGLPFVSSNIQTGNNVFANPNNGITFTVSSWCTPISSVNKLQQTVTTFSNVKQSISDYSVFNMPSTCSSPSSSQN